MSSLTVSLIALGVGGLSLLVSVLTFLRNSPNAQLRRDQRAHMRVLSSRAIVLWDQLQTLIASQENKHDVDPYLYGAMRINARRVEDCLDRAIGLGLWSVVVGERKDHAIALHAAFTQSLVDASSKEEAGTEPWLKLHLLMGMVRLPATCAEHEEGRDGGVLKGALRSRTNPDLLRKAWGYLEE